MQESRTKTRRPLVAVVVGLLALASDGPCRAGEPIDPERLSQMRQELDAY
jgi:hypothetical protein